MVGLTSPILHAHAGLHTCEIKMRPVVPSRLHARAVKFKLSCTISACGVDKNYLKWQEIQLAMHCGESSLIDHE